MTSKKANWLFLTLILVHIGVVLFLFFAGEAVTIDIVMNFVLSEGILMVPALLFLLFSGGFGRPGQREAAGFHKIKISTVLMIVLCTLLIMPLVTVLNTLTMFFADNAVAALQGDILRVPFPIILFMIGIFGPFCEEFVFRGVMYRSYCRSNPRQGGSVLAVLLSALTFGLMHMNFNQALYAFGIGVFLALLVEAAGSLWASIVCHVFFNSLEVVLMYASGHILDSVYGKAVMETAGELTTRDLMAVLSVYLVIAAIATPIAVCILVWIAKNEGQQAAVQTMFHRPRQQETVRGQKMPGEQEMMPEQTEPMLSIPLVIAVVLCLGYMSLELFL